MAHGSAEAIARLNDIKCFYDVLSRLEKSVGGKRLLRDFSRYRDWPVRGVYIFFEPGEHRGDSGDGPRTVRVGTHALKHGAQSTLRQRLSQHRGSVKGGGNHRGSIFRLLVGQAMMTKGEMPPCQSWGVKSDLSNAAKALGMDREAIRNAEQPLEEAVSRHIGAMPFLWLDIGDAPSPDSHRGYIERNAIALLSNRGRPPLDPASAGWLGGYSNRADVSESGLWNQRHVAETHDPGFISALSQIVDGMAA